MDTEEAVRHRAHQQKYYDKNHDDPEWKAKRAEANRRYKEKNATKLREKAKEYSRKTRQDRREDHNLACRRWRDAHHSHILEYIREYTKELTLKYAEFMEGKVCVVCGEPRLYVLQWHHRDPKTKQANIASLRRRKVTWEVLLEELNKCDLLCANCHAELHHNERTKDDGGYERDQRISEPTDAEV